jgi:CRISPR/Cas system CMR-associated protein Cmr5 small subunit
MVNAGQEAKEQYLRNAEGFPSLVHINGLAQATSFFTIDKEDRPHYLTDIAIVLNMEGVTDARSLHKRALAANVEEYMHLTRDVMIVAGWLKRYAQAYLRTDDVT